MGKTMTALQLAANQQNALKSTGPRSVAGRAAVKCNAVKHGLLSQQALIKGGCIKESGRELATLQRRFYHDLKPCGAAEEMLVDQIVTAQWRLKRALRAEAAELAKDDDDGQFRRDYETDDSLRGRLKFANTEVGLESTAGGTVELKYRLEDLAELIEKEGELTEAAIKKLVEKFDGKPNRLTERLDEFRLRLAANPEKLEPKAFQEYKLKEALDYIDQKLDRLDRRFKELDKREKAAEKNDQAAACLPSDKLMDRLMRYETKLEKQISRAMDQLQRLQLARNGGVLPVPMTLDVPAQAEPSGLLNEPSDNKAETN